jgi:hypothetical protein
MRLLLLLLLAAAAPVRGQVLPEPTAPRYVSSLLSQPERGDTAHQAAEPARQLRRSAEGGEARSAGAAQPSVRNFLYQILITAVSALVTALIWKAVF